MILMNRPHAALIVNGRGLAPPGGQVAQQQTRTVFNPVWPLGGSVRIQKVADPAEPVTVALNQYFDY